MTTNAYQTLESYTSSPLSEQVLQQTSDLYEHFVRLNATGNKLGELSLNPFDQHLLFNAVHLAEIQASAARNLR